jgi:hypothetical protein
METAGADLRQMQRTPLAASHVQALRVLEFRKSIRLPSKSVLARVVMSSVFWARFGAGS